jgi:tetratricopeptide (TPR) repeat protein
MSAAALIAAPTTLETARRHHAQGNLLHAAQAYREILLNDPRSQAALLGLSLIARQSNQQQAALRMAHAALAAGPDFALAWANLADILAAFHQPARAEPIFRHALRLDPGLAAAHYGLGNCLALREDFAAALQSFQSAAQLAPSVPEFHFALGFAQGKLGQHAQAIAAYRRAVTLRPGFASAWLNLGVELIADGRDSLAHPCYRQALAAGNSNTRISAHLNLGHLARRRQRFPQAEAHYNAALALASAQQLPENRLSEIRLSEVHVAFTYLHLEQQHFPAARESLQSAESADPTRQNPEIPNVLGILLLAEHTAQPPMAQPPMRGSDSVPAGMPDWTKGTGFSPYIHRDQDDGASAPEGSTLLHQAIAAFQQAEALGHKTAASNRGNALLRLGRCQEALAAHQAALTRDPCHPGLRYNLALTQLRLGDYAHGWPNYEIRWQFREVHPHPRRFRQPRWQGEALPAGATLLLYAEQGLGDTLQFVRYLPLIAERMEDAGAPHLASEMWETPDPTTPKIHLILEVQPPLARLLRQSTAPLVRSHRITAEVLPHGARLPAFTHHCPLMSLPAIFQTTLETVPSPIPYLQSDPEQAQSRAVELANLGAPPLSSTIGPLIGLNWAGNPNYRADHERSTHLLTFLPLLQLPGIHWVSLQKGEAAAHIATLPADISLHDGCSRDRDLADAAALVANLDLVLTTDTAIAHLAGALGKPLWLLLPWQSDWRWMQDRLTTPWYPTARLFRQSSPNAWPELISRVATELAARLAALCKPPATPL